MTDDTERRDTPTISAPPPSGASNEPTNPHASEAPIEFTPERRPALQPPPPDDLAATQLASTEPPEWFKASFIGQALTKFAEDARAIREGREQQHAAQMAVLAELRADYSLLRGEVQSFRRAVQAKDEDHDQQIAALRREMTELRESMATNKVEYERRFQEQQATLDHINEILDARIAAAQAASAESPTG